MLESYSTTEIGSDDIFGTLIFNICKSIFFITKQVIINWKKNGLHLIINVADISPIQCSLHVYK